MGIGDWSMTSDGIGEIRWHTVDGPAKSKSPVEDGGKHPIIYRVSSILLVVQDFSYFATIRSTFFPSKNRRWVKVMTFIGWEKGGYVTFTAPWSERRIPNAIYDFYDWDDVLNKTPHGIHRFMAGLAHWTLATSLRRRIPNLGRKMVRRNRWQLSPIC